AVQKTKKLHATLKRIDNPVFGHAGCFIEFSLFPVIALSAVARNDLDRYVRATHDVAFIDQMRTLRAHITNIRLGRTKFRNLARETAEKHKSVDVSSCDITVDQIGQKQVKRVA